MESGAAALAKKDPCGFASTETGQGSAGSPAGLDVPTSWQGSTLSSSQIECTQYPDQNAATASPEFLPVLILLMLRIGLNGASRNLSSGPPLGHASNGAEQHRPTISGSARSQWRPPACAARSAASGQLLASASTSESASSSLRRGTGDARRAFSHLRLLSPCAFCRNTSVQCGAAGRVSLADKDAPASVRR